MQICAEESKETYSDKNAPLLPIELHGSCSSRRTAYSAANHGYTPHIHLRSVPTAEYMEKSPMHIHRRSSCFFFFFILI